MAYNILSGKIEKGDWSCGAADDVKADEAARAKPVVAREAVMAFGLGALTGGAFLYWSDMRKHIRRVRLPENA